jgi:aspartate aminotransferase/aminotransferase
MRPPRYAAEVKALSRSVVGMRPSGIRSVFDLAVRQPGVVTLHVGEPDFPTPQHILDAAAAAAAEGFTRYTANRGLLSVREAICRKLARVNGLHVEPELVHVTAGGVNALTETFWTLLDPGDEIVAPDPAWPNYVMAIEALGAVPVRYRLRAENDFEPDLDELAALCARPRAKVLLVNSPGNPTGAVWRRETLERCLELAREHDLRLISDEVYDEIVFDGEHWSPATADGDGRVISIYSVSKTYAMTGWRIGYLTASEEIVALLAKLHEPVVSCATSIAQKAAEAALDGPQDCVATMREAYRVRRDLAVALLREHDMLTAAPRGAFYILADVSRAAPGENLDFCLRLVREHGVAVAPGDSFGPGGDGLVRLSLAADEAAIREGIERLAAAVDREAAAVAR